MSCRRLVRYTGFEVQPAALAGAVAAALPAAVVGRWTYVVYGPADTEKLKSEVDPEKLEGVAAEIQGHEAAADGLQ